MAEHAVSPAATPTLKAPWHQQPGENDLWYSRFMRFVALGPSRSVSLVAKGRRNAYPIPAHWPIQAKQRQWRERASALDAALREGTETVVSFNDSLRALAEHISGQYATETLLLDAVLAQGGYRVPPDNEEDDYEAPRAAAGR